ncbi:hypothetical protein [Legionella sp. km772]|uniref:hypothetical protein n=1 Tax=Legionella sp. km772 TaxID=2498111 RepID=UPI000F8E0B76|nr:hypothetical protein [Legionella sp. km772]RUR08084.1 hypothetical protein ELY15_11570 [Legionella sp. km772]
MSCTLEFPESLVKIDFCSKGNKQKILIDVLTKYSDMDINRLASVLEVPVKKLHEICDGNGFLIGEQADSLAQLFLMFLGAHFFRKCTLIRKFVD